MRTAPRSLTVCLLLGGVSANVAAAINIETVPVGNPGNPGDSRYVGHGSVGYRYNIGKYEVTATEYTVFLNAVAGVDTYNLYSEHMARTDFGCGIIRAGSGTSSDPYKYSVLAAFANRPVSFVEYWDACRFANWLHNRQPTGGQDLTTTEDGAYFLNGVTERGIVIPRSANWRWALTSDDEWYKAAYHKNNGVTGDYWDYPTSTNAVPGRDLADVVGNNANYYGDPIPLDSGIYTTFVGEFQNSTGPYGTFDQAGNVWEWTEAVITLGARGVRGGSFGTLAGTLHASFEGSYFMKTEYGRIGFRVTQIPEPATMMTLAMAAAIVRRRAWK